MTQICIQHVTLPSLGSLWAACDDQGLLAIAFSAKALSAALAPWDVELKKARRHEHRHLKALQRACRRYALGHPTTFDLPWRLPESFPLFWHKVLLHCRKIPWGKYMSYKELAQRAGHPHAARAVGQAMARNPLPLMIPCHRVLAAGHQLGGFSGGLPLKRRLLALEGIL